MNRLKALADLGQSIWIDYIRRDLILGGGLECLVREDGRHSRIADPVMYYLVARHGHAACLPTWTAAPRSPASQPHPRQSHSLPLLYSSSVVARASARSRVSRSLPLIRLFGK